MRPWTVLVLLSCATADFDPIQWPATIGIDWYVECSADGALGLSMEGIQFIVALHQWAPILPLTVFISDMKLCERQVFPLLDQHQREVLAHLFSGSRQSHRMQPPRAGYIAVIHHDPGRYENMLTAHNRLRATKPLFVIGRSVFETDCIPTAWVPHTALADEIWVPSTSGAAAFSRCGCVSPVYAIPPPLALSTANYTRGAESGLVLLSVFKWERRKDWRTLLRSYWTEFTSSDNVTLLLRTEPNDSELKALRRQVIKSLQVPPAELPTVRFITGKLNRTAMDSLLSEADALVQCSHGEGWGLPAFEAMRLGTAVFAAAFGGAADFVREDTAVVLPHTMVPAPLDGHKWAQVDETALKKALRRALTNRAAVRAVGIRGQQFVRTHFAPHMVAKQVFQRLANALSLVHVRLERFRADCQLLGSILRPFECFLHMNQSGGLQSDYNIAP